MFGNRATLHWYVGEEQWRGVEATANPVHTEWSAAPPMLAEQRLFMRMARSLLLAFLVTTLAASAAMSRHEYNALRMRAAIQRVADLEIRALQTNDRPLEESVLENRVALIELSGWLGLHRVRRQQRQDLRVQIIDAHLDTGAEAKMAFVAARVDPPAAHWVPVPYLETRFYRQHGGQWLRTTPPADFWGERRVLETEHLRRWKRPIGLPTRYWTSRPVTCG